MRADLIPALAAALFLAGAAGPHAETIHGAALPKGHYAKLDQLPDWGGVWVLERSSGDSAAPVGKGEYAKRFEAMKAAAAKNNGEFPRENSYCTPPGVPYQMSLPQYPMEFLFTPGRVTMLFEAWMTVRRVFTDGRGHPENLESTFYGHSTGKWEGDTLVVETVGIKPEALIVAGFKHSEKETVAERIHLLPGSPDTLVDEVTITDPEALAQPWSRTYRYKRHREWELLEYVCAENDQNPVDSEGKAAFQPAGK